MSTPAPLPKKVVVGPYTYTVHSDPDHWDQVTLNSEVGLYGKCCHTRHEISLDPRMVPSAKREVFLHELIHVVSNVSGRVLGDVAKSMKDTEEAVAVTLSPALLDLLRRNPAVVAYLTDKTC